MRIDSCAFHSCAKPCSLELKGCGGCTCHNMNWEKAGNWDAILSKQIVIKSYEESTSSVVTRQSKRRNKLK